MNNKQTISLMHAATDELYHHGILGMHWGQRNGPPYPLSSSGGFVKPRKSVFVSGSSKTQDAESGYYRKHLPGSVRRRLKKSMSSGDRILVGDAPGIDRQVQDYLASKGYGNVTVYTPVRKGARYAASDKFKIKNVVSDAPEGSKEWLAKKDIEMSKDADSGIAVILDSGAAATRRNIDRLLQQNKDVYVYELSSHGRASDRSVKDTLAFSTRTAAVSDLVQSMQSDIQYREYDKLRSHDEVARLKSGDCHSQVQYEYEELKRIGALEPKALFMMEYDPKTNSGGSTHSACYYTDGGKAIWIENAWSDNKGMHIYKSEDALLKDIKKKFVKSGDKSKYSEIATSVYDPSKHKPGETLQEFIDKCLT